MTQKKDGKNAVKPKAGTAKAKSRSKIKPVPKKPAAKASKQQPAVPKKPAAKASKPGRRNRNESPGGDTGIVIVDDDLTVDHEKINEERRAYLEEARSQEAFD